MANQFKVSFLFGGKKDKTFDNAIGKIQQSVKSVVKSAAGIAAAYVGVGKIKDFAKESVEAAKAQIDAETKLESVLQNVKSIQAQGPQAYKQSAQALKEVASNLQGVGVIGDEVTLAGMQQLATFQLSEKEISMLGEGMTDLLAQQKGLNASQQDAVGIGNMIGKVMNGQVSALSRVGISFDKNQEKILKNGNSMQKAATLAEVLKQNVGGVNKALAETDQGRIQQAANSWGDMKEEIGKGILPMMAKVAPIISKAIPMLQLFGTTVVDKIGVAFDWVLKKGQEFAPKVKQWIEKAKDKIKPVVEWAKGIAGKAVAGVSGTIEKIMPRLEEIKSIAEEIAAKIKEKFSKAFGAFVEIAKPAVEWLASDGLPALVNGFVTVAQKAAEIAKYIMDHWNIIGPIVAGIGTAVAGFKLNGVINNLQLISQGVLKLKDAKGITKIIGGIPQAFGKVKGVIGGVKSGAGGLFKLMTSKIGLIILAIGVIVAIILLAVKNWDKIKEVVGKVCSFVSEKWNGFIEGIKERFSGFVDGVKEKITTVKEWLLGIGEGIKSFFDGVGQWIGNLINGVVSVFKGFVNLYIKGMNLIIGGLNKFSIKTPDWFPGGLAGKSFGFNIPEIPLLAQGGIATKPTLAMVGEGKEKEAILPLSKLKGLLKGQSGNSTIRAVSSAGPTTRKIREQLNPSEQSKDKHEKDMPFVQFIFNYYGSGEETQVRNAFQKMIPEIKAQFLRWMEEQREKEQRTGFRRT